MEQGDGPSEAKRSRSWFNVRFKGEGGGRRVIRAMRRRAQQIWARPAGSRGAGVLAPRTVLTLGGGGGVGISRETVGIYIG